MTDDYIPVAPKPQEERSQIVAVSGVSELTCEHKERPYLISYGQAYCCYICWLEYALDEAESKLACRSAALHESTPKEPDNER